MHRRHVSPVTNIAGALIAGLVLVCAANAADKPKPVSSCVACHTDVEKIKEEAKGIPVPTGSALQAGKG